MSNLEEKRGAFVKSSSIRSVAAGSVSAQAIVEIVVAITIAWGFAITQDNYSHLLYSVLFAPVLLLRTEASTDKGVEWLLGSNEPTRRNSSKYILIVLLAFSVSALWAYSMAQIGGAESLADQALFYWAGITGFGAWFIGAGVAGSGAGNITDLLKKTVAEIEAFLHVAMGRPTKNQAQEHAARGAVSIAIIIFAAISGSLLTTAIYLGLLASAGVLIGVISTMMLIVVSARLPPSVKTFIAAVLLGLPFFIGFLARSLIVRIAATARYAHAGFFYIPRNWAKQILCIDLRYPPEILPGIRGHSLTLSADGLRQKLREDTGIEKGVTLALLGIVTIPAVLYRLSLKSTCWLYLPLLYLADDKPLSDTRDRRKLLALLSYKNVLEVARRGLALWTIAVTLVITMDWQKVSNFVDTEVKLVVPPIAYLWAIDLNNLMIWNIFSLISAAITLSLMTWCGFLRIHIESYDEDSISVASASKLKLLMRARTLSTFIFIVIALVQIILIMSDVELYLPEGVLLFLKEHYGPYYPC